MATQTPKYKLIKQGQEDYYNVDVVNENMDIIDTALKEHDEVMGEVSSQLAQIVNKDGSVPIDNLTIGTRKSGSTVGTNSFSSGIVNEASGGSSHVEGDYNSAIGDKAHVEGAYNLGATHHTHVEGYWNLASQGTVYTVNSTNDTLKALGLDSVAGLAAGDKLDVKIFNGKSISGVVISSIDTTNKVVFLTTAATISSNWTHVVKHGIYQNPIHVEGQDCFACGAYSHAEGCITKALGNATHAEGYNTLAVGINSHTEGDSCKSFGNNSHAECSGTIALGVGSHSEGWNTTAGGTNSHAEGEGCVAASSASHAEGKYTLAAAGNIFSITAFDNTNKTITLNAVSSIVIGSKLTIRRNADNKALLNLPVTAISGLVVTLNTTETLDATWTHAVLLTGWNEPAHAEGADTLAGYYAHAEGANAIASGECSHAEGDWTVASGKTAHVEGDHSAAIGRASHAEGINTQANGAYSHAEGSNNIANGSSSHVGGDQCQTGNGYYNQFAHGYKLQAVGNEQAVFGRYNSPSTTDLLQIGNGTSDSARSNAMRVTFNGDVISGTGVSLNGLNDNFSKIFVQNKTLGQMLANPASPTDIRALIHQVPSGEYVANLSMFTNITFPITLDPNGLLVTWFRTQPAVVNSHFYGTLIIRHITGTTGNTYFCSVYNTTNYTAWVALNG